MSSSFDGASGTLSLCGQEERPPSLAHHSELTGRPHERAVRGQPHDLTEHIEAEVAPAGGA